MRARNAVAATAAVRSDDGDVHRRLVKRLVQWSPCPPVRIREFLIPLRGLRLREDGRRWGTGPGARGRRGRRNGSAGRRARRSALAGTGRQREDDRGGSRGNSQPPAGQSTSRTR